MTHTPLPWTLVEVTDRDDDQSYRVTCPVNNGDGGYGSGWGDHLDNCGFNVFHDQHYYPMSPNKVDAEFIVKAVNAYYPMRDALEKIAAFDDRHAQKRLDETGSWSGFDEPGSVQIARAALSLAKGEKE
jgi:hypothetical protein